MIPTGGAVRIKESLVRETREEGLGVGGEVFRGDPKPPRQDLTAREREGVSRILEADCDPHWVRT